MPQTLPAAFIHSNCWQQLIYLIMKTGQIKIVELNIEERIQLAYCGEITFQYHNESQFTPVVESIKVTDCPDFESCMRFLKTKMRELVKEKRAKDYAKQRRVAGWV